MTRIGVQVDTAAAAIPMAQPLPRPLPKTMRAAVYRGPNRVVLEQTAAHRIPAVAIRAVSDAHDQSLPYDFARALDSRGHLSHLRLLGHVARRPHRLPELIRLGRSSRAAASALADFLDQFLTAWVACTAPFDRPCEVAAT